MDEDFVNYETMHDWLMSFVDVDVWRVLVKDIKLHILSANKKTSLIYTFNHAFPTSITEVQFDSTNTETTPITFTVEFRYQWFDFERVVNA